MEKGKKIVQTRQKKAKNNPPPWTVRGGWSMASPDSAPGQVRSAPRPWGLELPQSWPPNPRSATIFCIFLPCLIVFFAFFYCFLQLFLHFLLFLPFLEPWLGGNGGKVLAATPSQPGLQKRQKKQKMQKEL